MAWIYGGWYSDTILGTGSDDIIIDFYGHNRLEGRGGDDILISGCGNDTLIGDSDKNYVVNGSFEDLSGLSATNFGYVGPIPGWTNTGDGNPEIVRDGWVGMPAADGEYWIDTGTLGARVIDISQNIEGLQAGETYELSFQAGQWQEPSAEPDETMNVYWNGELIATIRPDVIDAYELYQFEIVAGSGDGTNTLRFEGVTDGSSDAQGVVIDDVQIVEAGDDILAGGRGADKMYGGAGDDILYGGRGNDLNSGGSGNDTFLFSFWDGTDVITDFEFGADRIKFLSCGYADFGDLGFSQSGSDTVIDFFSTTIIVENTAPADFSAGDFIFT